MFEFRESPGLLRKVKWREPTKGLVYLKFQINSLSNFDYVAQGNVFPRGIPRSFISSFPTKKFQRLFIIHNYWIQCLAAINTATTTTTDDDDATIVTVSWHAVS